MKIAGEALSLVGQGRILDLITENEIWAVMSETLGVAIRSDDRTQDGTPPRAVHGHKVMYVTGLDECVAKLAKMMA